MGDWGRSSGKNGKPEPNMCPSSGEWEAEEGGQRVNGEQGPT